MEINLFLPSRIFCVCVQEGALKKRQKNDSIFCSFSSEHTKLQILTSVEIGHFGTFLVGIFALVPRYAMRESMGLGMSTCARNVWLLTTECHLIEQWGFVRLCLCFPPIIGTNSICCRSNLAYSYLVDSAGWWQRFFHFQVLHIAAVSFALLLSSQNTCCLFVNLGFCLQRLSFSFCL